MADPLRALRHDLGKYVSLSLRFLPEEAPEDAVREALISDLLHTRRGPDGVRTAVEIWRDMRDELVSAFPDAPELEALDREMAVVEDVSRALRDGCAGPDDLVRGRAAALAVSRLCRAWARRA